MKPTPSILSDRPVPVNRRWAVGLVLLLLLGSLGTCLTRSDAPPLAEVPSPPASVVVPPCNAAPLPVVEIVLPPNHVDTIIEISASTDLLVPRAAFIDSAGAPVTEPVVIEVQEILNPVETFLAGIPMALDSGRVLKSAGMFDIQGRTASGGGIGIRQDRPLELELASLDADSAYTAWALDTLTGEWTEIDAFTGVKPLNDTAALEAIEEQIPAPPVTATQFSFTITDETGGQPELAEYANVKFEPVNGEECGFTCTQIDVFPQNNGIYDVRFIGHVYGYKEIAREETCPCYLAFDEGQPYSEAMRAYQRKHRKLIDERDREKKRVERAWKRYMRALSRQQLLADKGSTGWRQRSAERRVNRTLEVLQFGILNIDKPFVIDAPIQLMATYVDSTGTQLTLDGVKVVDVSAQVLYPCRDGLVQLHPGQDQLLFGTTPDGALAYIRMREIDLLTRDLEAFTFPMRVARLDDLSPEAVIDLLLPEEKT